MTTSVRYVGSPAFAGMLAQDLRAEGVEVDYERPEERRDAQALAEAVTIYLTCRGSEEAIKAVVAQFRKRWPKATVDIDAQDERGYR